MGVRYFDIRVDMESGEARIVHGLDDLNLTLEEAGIAFDDFLSGSGNECIFVRMQREETTSNVSNQDYYNEMIHIRPAMTGWQYHKIYTAGMLNAAADANKWTIGANRGAVIIVEFNNMSGTNTDVDNTNALITGSGGYSYLTAETAQKWNYVYSDNLNEFANGKFNRLNLYSSGGVAVAGIPVPNPKGFTQAFAAQYYNSQYLINLLFTVLAAGQVTGDPAGAFIVMDFEEEYDGRESFYRTIINMNSLAPGMIGRAKVFQWPLLDVPGNNQLILNYNATQIKAESDPFPPNSAANFRTKTVTVTNGAASASLQIRQNP
jgi:hypothetical protein